MKKNVPNILCMVRIILIPFILFFFIDNSVTLSMSMTTRILVSGILFAVAMFTDIFDGRIARKYDCVTSFGKFIDPIADKMLVLSVLAAYIQCGLINVWPVLLILAREFFVTGLRLMAAGNGVVVAANIWGKVKTFSQGLSIGAIYFYLLGFSLAGRPESFASVDIAGFTVFPSVMIWIVAAFTVVSAVPYYKSCRKYLRG